MIRTALALGIVLELVEILRRAPTWLLILVGLAVSYVILLVISYFWWIFGGVAALAVLGVGRRIAERSA